MKGIMKYAFVLAAVSMVAVVGIQSASADAADPKQASVRIVGGIQSLIGTAAIDLKDVNGFDPAWNEDAQVVTADTDNLKIQDHRGSASGWYVTLESSDFVGQDEIASESISASLFTVQVDSFARISGQATDEEGGPSVGAGSATPLDSPVILVEADNGYGMGVYNFDLLYALTIPALQLSGAYEGTATFTLYSSAVPTF